MSLRNLVDSAGNEWLVFDVIPPAQERRRTERRTSGEVKAVPEGESESESERRDADRRLTVGGAGGISGTEGWLCFERTGVERRRLSPIPDDWKGCDDAQLEAYLDSARRVGRNSVSMQELADRTR